MPNLLNSEPTPAAPIVCEIVLSVSIAAAKKKIDLACAANEVRDISSKKEIAKKVLKEAKKSALTEGNSITNHLDNLLEALAEEENFITED